MNYASPKAFEAALRVRLPGLAADVGRSIDDVRREIAFDRFIARLTASSPGKFLLKGGVAIALRFAAGDARRTRDVDIETRGGHASLPQIIDLVRNATRAQSVDKDFFIYTIVKQPERPLMEGLSAYRFTIDAALAGRSFNRFTIDVGLRDTIEQPERIVGRPFLEFAGIPAQSIDALPVAPQIAEKVHGFSVRHGEHESSRTKDFVDLVMLAERCRVSAGELRRHLIDVFIRHSNPAPSSTPAPPPKMRVEYVAIARDLPIPADVDVALATLRNFLDPVLAGKAGPGKYWDPDRRDWIPELSPLLVPTIRRARRDEPSLELER